MRARSLVRPVFGEALAWFAVLTGFYFALVSSHGWPEIVVGLGAGAVGATAAVLSRTAEGLRYRPALVWLRWLGPLPSAVLGDTARLAGVLYRHVIGRRPARGGMREITVPADDTARGSAHRAQDHLRGLPQSWPTP